MKFIAGIVLALAAGVGGYVLWFTVAHAPGRANPADLVGKDIGNFPYHPLVYHLDLSTLSYQLYSQTLLWPFDPYYDESDDRSTTIGRARTWVRMKGAEQVRDSAGLEGYRGPGVLAGFPDNPVHDPILFSYARLSPWSNSITNADGIWTEYRSTREITGRIRAVYMCYRKTGGAEDEVVLEQVRTGQEPSGPDATDTLLAFEGGTGDKGEASQPMSQSLMGFVLVREDANGAYDVHVTFRGSRSGSAPRAALGAISTSDASGNPDWITDLGYRHESYPFVSATGEVHRGFARSVMSIAPTLLRCLEEVAGMKSGAAPRHIYVTGHSLGGALAQHFVSAVLLGDYSDAAAMPMPLRNWPWKQIKLISFSAPRAGDEEWARHLTTSGLEAGYYESGIQPYDTEALVMTEPDILTRLLNPRRPAGYRVLISKDPITSQLGGGGGHVGTTVYLNVPSPSDVLPPPDFTAHEPFKLRELMVEGMEEARAPPAPWHYRPMLDLNPEQDPDDAGSIAELRKLTETVKRYYTANGIPFDHAAFDWGVTLRLAMEGD